MFHMQERQLVLSSLHVFTKNPSIMPLGIFLVLISVQKHMLLVL